MKRNNTITSFMLSLILCLSLSCKGKEKDNKGLILGLLVLSNNSKTASSSATFTISGTITGLTASGLVLTNNSADDLSVASGSTSFKFNTPVKVEAHIS